MDWSGPHCLPPPAQLPTYLILTLKRSIKKNKWGLLGCLNTSRRIAPSEIASELMHDALAHAPVIALSVSLARSTTEKEVV